MQLKTLEDVFNYPDPTYLIDPLLIEGTVTILGAYTGAGKSITALSIIKSVLTGISLWGKFTVVRNGPVLLVDEETPDSFLKERLTKLGFNQSMPIHFLHFAKLRLDKEADFQDLMERVGEVKPILVVIDSLIRIHRQKEDDNTQMALVVDKLREIANSGTTVLVIHHHKKGDSRLSERLRGASDIPGGIDVEYALVVKDNHLTLSSVKTRTKPFGPVRLKMEVANETIEVKYLGTEAEEILFLVKEVLGEKGMGIQEIYEALKDGDEDPGLGVNKLRTFLLEAVHNNQLKGEKISQKGEKGGGKKWVISLPETSSLLTDPIHAREEVKKSPEKEDFLTDDVQKTKGGREEDTIDGQGEKDFFTGAKNTDREEVEEDEIDPHGGTLP